MTTEILSLAKYLASSRSEFTLLEMNQYLSRKYEEKDLHAVLKPHFYDLDLFCSADYKCTKLVKGPLPSDEGIISELEEFFKNPELPLSMEKLIEAYIERSCGKNWHKGETATQIRENIVKQKEEYWKGEGKGKEKVKVKGESRYPMIRVISYLLYHFPVYFCQYQYLLLELFKGGVLMNKMSIVDVGSGPGTITLSTLDFLRKLQDIYSRNKMDVKLNIRIGSIEHELENIRCYRELTSGFLLSGNANILNSNITIDESVHSPVETAPVPGDVDLMIFSNVLAELRSLPHERADVVERIASVSKNPTLIIIEPADLDNSKALRVSQHALIKKGFNVYSPCSFIWGRLCSGINCWSFQEPGNIKVPGFMEKIADTEDSYRYLNTDMKFSSVILRKDRLTKHAYRAKGKIMALSNLKKHIKKHINVAVSVMSGNLGDEKTFVSKICDGTASFPCYAVMPVYHMSENNRALIDAGYGDIIEISGTLVRENVEQSSFNLFITRNTIVNIVG
ncbi:MAG: Mitochondrial small ribosomal subunit Rsm22 [Candidatus Methanoperedens nitroreducens]|uniref:Mitochondrial small ribosomal subunit Rsm22 n=1 Tax=Candidatus Methanoperedens nitratireducens TaxID=1392998 RepID=A0A0P8CL36_9EURY|nr:small ribosomal subunit Rsm22 family protein [Candidatus Methanoperedens sp. BLZ2]KAB2943413.1 MAG: hypothetical protein F9K14_15830 [Candidatus Methanoperedens sp.]KPQ43877.1 MAG: Mitochondrial small ribosomal subunit Rsm22 [Candidatus Methanoperedens sp. BLZ1]MBZ0176433.1 small ribosomal subunit Rsm22 family protein [Candidatus Methanoperedens nitroreducens]MCX9078626.1 hypothetical protein [Candidatus Methanoperedens sp.]